MSHPRPASQRALPAPHPHAHLPPQLPTRLAWIASTLPTLGCFVGTEDCLAGALIPVFLCFLRRALHLPHPHLPGLDALPAALVRHARIFVLRVWARQGCSTHGCERLAHPPAPLGALQVTSGAGMRAHRLRPQARPLSSGLLSSPFWSLGAATFLVLLCCGCRCRIVADYFSLRLHKTVEYEAGRPYLCTLHPHGILAFAVRSRP